jgi:7-carboxy-7-deazaguanine synthase
MKEWKKSRIKGTPYKFTSIQDLVSSIKTSSVVVTGGEPCIHKELVPLLKSLTRHGKHVTVETNASMLPEGAVEWYDDIASGINTVNVLWSLSPKLGSSLGTLSQQIEQLQPRESRQHRKATWINLHTIQWFVTYTACQLKFVISDPLDLLDVQQLVRQINFGVYRRYMPIVLQPNGNVIRHALREEAYLSFLRDLQAKAIEMSKELDLSFRALPQLHVLLHGQRRLV